MVSDSIANELGGQIGYLTIILFLESQWAMSQEPMRLKAEWAIDSEAMRTRGIIVLVKSI